MIDSSIAYRKCMAGNVANSGGSHTQRALRGEFTGEPFAGANEIKRFITANITPDSRSRIFRWSQKNFVDRFPMGRVIPKSPMPWESFGRMNDVELKAIDAYLETLKSVKAKERVK